MTEEKNAEDVIKKVVSPKSRGRKLEPMLMQRRGLSKQEPPLLTSNPQVEVDQRSESQNKGGEGEFMQKSPKQFLKRKSKKVEEKKVVWNKVSKRIDCWNSKPKETNSKFLEKKQMLLREAALPKERKINKERKKNTKNQTPKERKQNPKRNPQIPEFMPTNLNVYELREIYFQYHGENQSIIFTASLIRPRNLFCEKSREFTNSCSSIQFGILSAISRRRI